MDIKTFIEQMTGDWFAQRTVYQLATMTEASGKSNLSMVFVSPDDAAIAPLCEQCQVDPARVWGGIRTKWDTSVDPALTKQPNGESLLVFLSSGQEGSGALLCSGMKQAGEYCLGDDDVLNLRLKGEGDLTLTDRFWFATENLRFRTSVLAAAGQPQKTSFYSEIRRMQS